MIGGDETAALVGDLGSRTFKAGFAGEDMPKSWMPSAMGAGGQLRDGALRCKPVELTWARDNGRVHSWDAVEALWGRALGHDLNSDAKAHPLLVAAATYEAEADRLRLAEVLFEKLGAPAVFLARNAMLSAFSLGRATALVVDIGAARTCAAAVHDGFVMNKTIRQSRVGGDLVDAHLSALVEASPKGGALIAPAELQLMPASYAQWRKKDVLQDLKANICRVWQETGYTDDKVASFATETYELPDGTTVHLGPERFRSSELLMRNDADAAFVASAFAGAKAGGGPDVGVGVVPELVRDALQASHVDLRRELASQIILVGGGSVLPGTVERLTKEVGLLLPSALKPRVLVLPKHERTFSTFTGASILATLGSFQQLWVSKSEYDEFGAGIVSKRCVH